MAVEPVTAVLLDRLREPPGLRRMLTWSIALHVMVGVLVAVVPVLRPASTTQTIGPVMTIRLGGGSGPSSGGLNPLGGRPIQTTVPLPDPRKPEPLGPPAARTPAMTMPATPAQSAKRSKPPSPPVTVAPDEARGRTPIRGDQEAFGSAIAETSGQGFGGLSTGGGGTNGFLEGVTDFCCPEYLGVMQQQIQRNWMSRQEVSGSTVVKFRILRDGRITDLVLERSSGYVALDLAAQRAILVTRQLPPLPSAFPEESLTVHLMFEYRK